MKRCCRCGEEKPVAEFYRRAVAGDGLSAACKACLADRRRRRRELSETDKVAEVEALRGRTEKRCGQCGEIKPRDNFGAAKASRDGMRPTCRDCVAEYGRGHYEANKAKRSDQARAWYEANREQRLAQKKAWSRANRERVRATRRAWLDAHPGFMAEFMRQRRARIAGVTVLPVDLEALWTGFCGICGDEMDRELKFPDPLSPSVDHIIPIARGGAHSQDNLQWAHLLCNAIKSDSLPEEVA